MPSQKAPLPQAPRQRSSAETPAADSLESAPPVVHDSAAAFAQVRPLLAAVPAARLTPPRFNVRQAALLALGLADHVQRSGLRVRLERLASVDEFDRQQLDRLAPLAQATWYIRHRLDTHTAMSSTAKLPAPLVAECTELRGRMLRVLTFHFADVPEVGPKLDYLRQGSGYQDLASDLLQLAELYGTHRDALQGTPRYYDPGDELRAAQLGASILGQLGLAEPLTKGGAPADAEDWADLQKRAMFLLTKSFNAVAAAGTYLHRDDPKAQARFVPLNGQLRSATMAAGKAARKKPRAGTPTAATATISHQPVPK